MLGWERVVSDEGPEPVSSMGFRLETFDTGQWLTIWWGKRHFTFTRYTANRHTGPEENRSVLRYFLGGPERRTKTRDFRSGFKEASKKPIPTRAEVEARYKS